MRREQSDESRLGYLPRLVDHRERETLQGEDVRARHECRDRAHIHSGSHEPVFQFVQTRCLFHHVANEERAEPPVATVLAAEPQKADARIAEHGAYLVNGAVGVCRKQYRRLPVGCQLLLYDVAHCRGGLASARRTHKQEVVACLHGAQKKRVEIAAVAFREPHTCVAPW